MCQDSSSAWTAQNHRPQMPQRDVAAELQGSSRGETASQDHSRLRVSVWFDCCNISPPREGSIHLAVVAEFQWEVTLTLSSRFAGHMSLDTETDKRTSLPPPEIADLKFDGLFGFFVQLFHGLRFTKMTQ
jgi:hypothetical protein